MDPEAPSIRIHWTNAGLPNGRHTGLHLQRQNKNPRNELQEVKHLDAAKPRNQRFTPNSPRFSGSNAREGVEVQVVSAALIKGGVSWDRGTLPSYVSALSIK